MSNPSEKIITGPFLASYAWVIRPRKAMNSDEMKYQLTMIFSKKNKATIEAIEAAIQRVIKAKWGTKPPKGLKIPLRDGDKERDEPYFQKSMFMNATASLEYKPGVVDADMTPIISTDQFYSGCIARATVSLFAFEQDLSKGVGCGLHNIQKLADGERLDGNSSPEQDFEAFEGEVDLDQLR